MSDGQTPRGRKLVEISGTLFFEFMVQGRVWGDDRVLRITHGLPEDAEMVALHYDPDRDRWLMTVASAEWPPSKPGEPLEHRLIQYQTEERWRSTATPPEVDGNPAEVLLAWEGGERSSGAYDPSLGGSPWFWDVEGLPEDYRPLWWQQLAEIPPALSSSPSEGDSDA